MQPPPTIRPQIIMHTKMTLTMLMPPKEDTLRPPTGAAVRFLVTRPTAMRLQNYEAPDQSSRLKQGGVVADKYIFQMMHNIKAISLVEWPVVIYQYIHDIPYTV